MVRHVTQMLRRLQPLRPHFRTAFEWPRYCSGWSDAALDELLKLLPYSTTFDGCAYGLRSARASAGVNECPAGWPAPVSTVRDADSGYIRKPWRVVTDYVLSACADFDQSVPPQSRARSMPRCGHEAHRTLHEGDGS